MLPPGSPGRRTPAASISALICSGEYRNGGIRHCRRDSTSSGGTSVAGSSACRWRAKIRTESKPAGLVGLMTARGPGCPLRCQARGYRGGAAFLAEPDEAHQVRALGCQLEPQRAAHGQVLPGPCPQRAHRAAPGHGRASGRSAFWSTLAYTDVDELAAVPQHLPDLGQRRPGAQHLGGQRVPQLVRSPAVKPGPVTRPGHGRADTCRRQLPVRPAHGYEHCARLALRPPAGSATPRPLPRPGLAKAAARSGCLCP